MASPSLCPEFEVNLVSNGKVIELVLQLKSAKAYGKNYMKVKPHLVRHLLRNRLLLRYIISLLATHSFQLTTYSSQLAINYDLA